MEKPVTSEPRSGRLLAEAFRERGLVGCVGHIERYNPALRALRARLVQGELGSVSRSQHAARGPSRPEFAMSAW